MPTGHSLAPLADVWAIYTQHYGLDAKQARPDDTNWTGAEIKSCCRLASLLDVPLAPAARNVVPVAMTAGDKIEGLRQWASGRCRSADRSNASTAALPEAAGAMNGPAAVKQARGVCTESQAQAGRDGSGDRKPRQAARGCDRRAWGRRSCHERMLRRESESQAPLARHLTDCLGQADGSGGGGVSCCVPGVWWRHPNLRRRPAGAGSLRTGGSQAGEGQDGFARVKSAPDTPRRTARASAHLSRPWSADRLGRARACPRRMRPRRMRPRRMRRDSDVARRTARDRHSQPLTGSHVTVRTAREKGGFKAGLRRRDKSDLERG